MGARKVFDPMSNVQKVSVALTPEFMALLKEAVDTGEYTSASEVIPRCAAALEAASRRPGVECGRTAPALA
jgi:Arc/MetJ-type ribon-helix-helix transcriptional regulator